MKYIYITIAFIIAAILYGITQPVNQSLSGPGIEFSLGCKLMDIDKYVINPESYVDINGYKIGLHSSVVPRCKNKEWKDYFAKGVNATRGDDHTILLSRYFVAPEDDVVMHEVIHATHTYLSRTDENYTGDFSDLYSQEKFAYTYPEIYKLVKSEYTNLFFQR